MYYTRRKNKSEYKQPLCPFGDPVHTFIEAGPAICVLT